MACIALHRRRALARCHLSSCYNDRARRRVQGRALARCHLSSCYNPARGLLVNAGALARCHLSSCYNECVLYRIRVDALARCHLSSCYNSEEYPQGTATALARCHLSSCYNIHPRKKPLAGGFLFSNCKKGRKSINLSLLRSVFLKKEEEGDHPQGTKSTLRDILRE